MATVLDLSLLQSFDVVFPFILVWAVVFAILQKFKPISDSASVNAVIGAVAGFMVLLSRVAIDVINFMVPWFVIAFIFLLLMLIIFQIFGADDDMFKAAVSDPTLRWALTAIGIIILAVAIGKVAGQSLTDASFEEGDVVLSEAGDVDTDNFQTNIVGIIFNPKVLGLLVIFAIAIFTVAFLSA
jgi:hypothetical protein